MTKLGRLNLLIVLTIVIFAANVFGGINPVGQVAVAANGDIITAAEYKTGYYDDIAVRKHRANGLPDSRFGAGGRVVTSLGSVNTKASGVLIQPDGKILVSASLSGNPSKIVLIRYTGSGALDTTFGGGDGIVIQGVGNNSFFSTSLALQTDGKIVVIGSWHELNLFQKPIAFRFNANGTLDTSFGFLGLAAPALPSDWLYASSVVIQTDGKILMTCRATVTGRPFVLIRLNPNGTLDPTFNTDGVIIDPHYYGNANANSVALLANRKIVAASYYVAYPHRDQSRLSRFTAAGNLDTYSIYGDGSLRLFYNGMTDFYYAERVAVDRDEQVLVAGRYQSESGLRYFDITKTTNAGTIDTTFAGGGHITEYLGNFSRIIGLVPQYDRKIVAFVQYSPAGYPTSYMIVRYNPDGTRDTTFNSIGEVIF